MTTPSILFDDMLIRKYRIDELLPKGERQYLVKSDGTKWPVDLSFKFPSKHKEETDNSISVYVESFLEGVNIPIELLLETVTRKRPEQSPDVKYGAFLIPVRTIMHEYFDLVEIIYDYDSLDPIPQRGLCHVLISFKEKSKKAYNSNRADWAVKMNVILQDQIKLVERKSFRVS